MTPRHPIGVVSNRTGIPPDLLRAWERRYGAVEPQRTETGRRLYSDLDIRRLGLLKRLVGAGRRISDVAALALDTLEAMAAEDDEARSRSLRAPVTGREIEPRGRVEAALDAAMRLDKTGLERVLTEASLSLSAPEMRREVIVPLLHEIGERWREGSVRVVHEHLASVIVRKFVDGQRDRSNGEPRPRIIVTTPVGQQHELGALMVAAAAEEVGWEAVYLGANLPAEEIGTAARQLDARVVAISVVYKSDVRHLADELRTIRRCLGPDVTLLVGGRAAPAISDVVIEVGGIVVSGVGDFLSRLDAEFGAS